MIIWGSLQIIIEASAGANKRQNRHQKGSAEESLLIAMCASASAASQTTSMLPWS
jgi:hypothetical protein